MKKVEFRNDKQRVCEKQKVQIVEGMWQEENMKRERENEQGRRQKSSITVAIMWVEGSAWAETWERRIQRELAHDSVFLWLASAHPQRCRRSTRLLELTSGKIMMATVTGVERWWGWRGNKGKLCHWLRERACELVVFHRTKSNVSHKGTTPPLTYGRFHHWWKWWDT